MKEQHTNLIGFSNLKLLKYFSYNFRVGFMKLWERKLPLIFYKDIMELSLLMEIQEAGKPIQCSVMMMELFLL